MRQVAPQVLPFGLWHHSGQAQNSFALYGLVAQLVRVSARDSWVTCPEVASSNPTMERSDTLKGRAVHQTMVNGTGLALVISQCTSLTRVPH